MRALVAIAMAGNFSLAARRIGVSQPSLHRAARDMEILAGTRFFSAFQIMLLFAAVFLVIRALQKVL